MVNTWRTSYFQTEGTRVLFLLPQCWTDAFIPMTVQPAPRQILRVMVGRLELLSSEREHQAEAAIADLASDDTNRRAAAFTFLRYQGRYVEPIIRRVLRTSKSERVSQLGRKLLQTDLVTDLRTATHNAADGRRMGLNPLLLRAHLARLLGEMGLERESHAEAIAVLRQLDQGETITDDPSDLEISRLEIRAAALDAAGIHRSAASEYASHIEARLGTMRPTMDQGVITWFREWWVGRAYGRCMVRAGLVDGKVADLEAAVSGRCAESQRGLHQEGGRSIRLNRILLAYLHEARGHHDLAERMWASLVDTNKPSPDVAVAELPGLP
jgi:hypothetical protein